MSTTKRKIKQGETSTGIANQYGITVKELMKLNPNITNPNRIYAGADIIVPVAIDGTVGTLGGSTAGSGSTGTGGTNTNPYNIPTAPTYQNTKWSDTDQGKAAWSNYQNYLNQYNNFGDFSFSKQGDLDSVYNNIKNYGDFSYDVNSDALYQQYADQYTRLGNLAMQDTMGQAAAMTGGYGNSYATTAGNQAYQGYLQQLNDVVPELYQMALNKWQMGKDDLYNQYGMLLSEYEREYGLHSDEYNKLLDSLGIARDDYYSGADMHYTEQGNYNDILNSQFNNNMSIWDANQSQSNWEKNYNLSERELAMEEEAWALEKAAYGDVFGTGGGSSSGSGGSSAGGSGSGSGSGGGNTTKVNNSVPSAISEKAATFKSNDALNDYLTRQRDLGYIDDDQMGQLYLENEIPSLSKRDWTLTDDGGVNWLWGVDNNAVVKDQYGNSYKLDKLVKALVAEGMSQSEAKAYVKKLQKSLGA